MKRSVSSDRAAITLVTYGHVRPTHEGADGSTWELAEHLYREGRLDRVLCYEFDREASARLGDRLVTPGRRVFLLAAVVLEKLTGTMPGLVRRIRERLFDWLVSHSSELRNAEVVVFRKPNFARSARALRRRDTPTIAIASILHPRMNFERVGAEAERLGLEDRSPYRDEQRMRQLERFFSECGRVLTTEQIGERSFADYGVPASAIITTPLMNGADCERFTPRAGPRDPGALRFLHLSTMNLIKGVGLLFDAWQALSLDDAELLLAGGMDETTEQLFSRRAPPHCARLGPVADSPACYRAADVFVSPSLSDSAPNTVLEALASGLPVIVSDACGASRLVEDGRNGFVYPWHDADALAERLRWFSANRDRLDEMGRAARETAVANPRGRFGDTLVRVVDEYVSNAD